MKMIFVRFSQFNHVIQLQNINNLEQWIKIFIQYIQYILQTKL